MILWDKINNYRNRKKIIIFIQGAPENKSNINKLKIKFLKYIIIRKKNKTIG